jgi:hypothetical protein
VTLSETTLGGSWLAAQQGVDPLWIERRRRAGELLAVRDPNRSEWRYPVWQFDADGHVRPAVAKLLELAREKRIPPARVGQLLERRVGLVGGRTVRELLLADDSEHVLAEIRAAV